MAEKALSQIKEAELRAQTLIKNAHDEATNIIKNAENEVADAFIKFSEARTQQALERKQSAEATARTASIEFSRTTTELCAALKQKQLLRESIAIDAAIQTIIV